MVNKLLPMLRNVYGLLAFAVGSLAILTVLGSRCGAESNFDFFFKSSDKYEDVVVQEVISTDSFVIEAYLKKGEKIRLIGLRAPEPPPKHKDRAERDEYGFVIEEKKGPLTSVEEKAFQFAKELLEGKHVRLELDSQKTSDDFKTLAYVFLLEDGTFVNEEILRRGFAHLQIRPPNLKYAERLRNAYQEARREMRGLQGQ